MGKTKYDSYGLNLTKKIPKNIYLQKVIISRVVQLIILVNHINPNSLTTFKYYFGPLLYFLLYDCFFYQRRLLCLLHFAYQEGLVSLFHTIELGKALDFQIR